MNTQTLTRKLTLAARLATYWRMTQVAKHGRGLVRGLVRGFMAVVAMSGVSGCITLSAPGKPIVIELNINIKQEVIYRLSADAGKTADANREIV